MMDPVIDDVQQYKLDKKLKRWEKYMYLKTNNTEKFLQGIILSRVYHLAKEHIEELIGCTLTQLKEHIESQFPQDWSWENHGTHWHIDHIVPIKYKDNTSPSLIDMLTRFNYKNHQPLSPPENLSKGNRYIGCYKIPEPNAEKNKKQKPTHISQYTTEDINAASADSIATAADISADEYSEITAPKHVITEAEHSAIAKYHFRRFYGYDREITPAVVLKYGKLRLKQQYLRRKRLRSFDGDVEEGLAGLLRGVAAAGVIAGVDVEHIKSVFDVTRDKIAIELMKIFGRPFDTTYVLSREELIAKLHAGHEKLVRECKFVCKTFSAKAVQLPNIGGNDYVKRMLDYINGKLDAQYGVKIKATNKHQAMYHLEDSFAGLFDENLDIK